MHYYHLDCYKCDGSAFTSYSFKCLRLCIVFSPIYACFSRSSIFRPPTFHIQCVFFAKLTNLLFLCRAMSARSKKAKQPQAQPEKVATPKKVERSRTTSGSITNPTSEAVEYRSPSPLNISRVDEKEELAHLNDRLASYIDYVRKLERDKDFLTRRISTISEERISQVDEARKAYEEEIASLRRLVDDLAKDKAAREVEMKKYVDDAADATSKLNKRDVELRNLQRKIDNLERDLSSYKQDHERYQQLRPEFEEMAKKLEMARKGLEAETILRTDLENKVASLREELDFKDRIFEEERSKLVLRSLTVEEEVEDRKAAELESRLADELQAYRQQTNDELNQYRIQMETTFQVFIAVVYCRYFIALASQL